MQKEEVISRDLNSIYDEGTERLGNENSDKLAYEGSHKDTHLAKSEDNFSMSSGRQY